jgi:pimeloyl-ACP methyl ester carboxylesterase
MNSKRHSTNLIATAFFTEARNMVRKSFLRVRFLPIALLALVATGGAAAQPNSTSNVILVHGAWADGSSWSRVIPLLDTRGINVTAVKLPLTSLADDVATTKRAIAHVVSQNPGQVVLVGHSHGVSSSARSATTRTLWGWYVAAFARSGSRCCHCFLSATPTPIGSHLVFDDGFFTIDPAGVEQDLRSPRSRTPCCGGHQA